jgi:hypothetical protein
MVARTKPSPPSKQRSSGVSSVISRFNPPSPKKDFRWAIVSTIDSFVLTSRFNILYPPYSPSPLHMLPIARIQFKTIVAPSGLHFHKNSSIVTSIQETPNIAASNYFKAPNKMS